GGHLQPGLRLSPPPPDPCVGRAARGAGPAVDGPAVQPLAPWFGGVARRGDDPGRDADRRCPPAQPAARARCELRALNPCCALVQSQNPLRVFRAPLCASTPRSFGAPPDSIECMLLIGSIPESASRITGPAVCLHPPPLRGAP